MIGGLLPEDVFNLLPEYSGLDIYSRRICGVFYCLSAQLYGIEESDRHTEIRSGTHRQ